METEATDSGSQPAELDPYSEYDVNDDIQWYGHTCREGEWFVEPSTGRCYLVSESEVPDGGRVTLTAAHYIPMQDGARLIPRGETHCCRTVCEIAGEIERQELVHVPSGCILDTGETALIRRSGILIHINASSFEATDVLSFGGNQRDATSLIDANNLPEPLIFVPPTPGNESLSAGPGISLNTISEPSARILEQSDANHYSAENRSVLTRFIPVPRFSKYTFELQPIRKWIESHLEGRVLNACAGQERLNHSGSICRNDIRESMPADTHLDVAELPIEYDKNSFDTVVFDPDWSIYQANLRYDGASVHKNPDEYPETDINVDDLPLEFDSSKNQVGHARVAKEGFDYLLRPGGKVIELSFQGSCMPARLEYERVERVMFDPIGEGKCVIGSVDRQVQQGLGQFFG